MFNTFAGNATVLIYLPFAKTKIFAMIKLLEKNNENFKRLQKTFAKSAEI